MLRSRKVSAHEFFQSPAIVNFLRELRIIVWAARLPCVLAVRAVLRVEVVGGVVERAGPAQCPSIIICVVICVGVEIIVICEIRVTSFTTSTTFGTFAAQAARRTGITSNAARAVV